MFKLVLGAAAGFFGGMALVGARLIQLYERDGNLKFAEKAVQRQLDRQQAKKENNFDIGINVDTSGYDGGIDEISRRITEEFLRRDGGTGQSKYL